MEPNQPVLSAELDIQPNGKGPFLPALVSLKGGVLITGQPEQSGTERDDRLPSIALPANQFVVSRPKRRRKSEAGSRKYCLKISLAGVDSHGNDKYIMDCRTPERYRTWLSMLQDAIVYAMDGNGKGLPELPNGEFYPNMLFVPLSESSPVVPAQEFALYAFLLVLFMIVVTQLKVVEDFQVNDAVKSMLQMTQFYKIKTSSDYLEWWPILLAALQRWSAQRAGWMAPDFRTGDPSIQVDEVQVGAVLLGMPYITQKRLLRSTRSSELIVSTTNATASRRQQLRNKLDEFRPPETLPPFNSTTEEACPWPLHEPTAKQIGEWGFVTSTTVGCYGSSTDVLDNGLPWFYRLDESTQAQYFLPEIQGVINGSYVWSPADWLSSKTLELSHAFTIYFPGPRRFAVVRITISFDVTGRVILKSQNGVGPRFETYEPFAYESSDGFWTTCFEVFVYFISFMLLASEVKDLYDCICMTELLLPLKCLTTSMELQLREIQYFHERASEVYDPRDPQTCKAFEFPDIADLRHHMHDEVEKRENDVARLAETLRDLKVRMLLTKGKPASSSKYESFRKEAEELQLRLIKAMQQARKERKVAEVAALLQLATMWKNKWSWDFPPAYLAELGANPSIAEDGLEAFKDVNWIDVSRAYIAFCESSDHTQHFESELSLFDMINELKFKVVGMFSDKRDRVGLSVQELHFDKLVPFVDFLDILLDAIRLHSKLVSARKLRHWTGPKGVQLSGTVERAFQKQIKEYNNIGRLLKTEMESFPAEIETGFCEPDHLKAETIKVKAQRLQTELKAGVDTAALLGLYWPGSPLWEIQRKARQTGKYSKSSGVWASIGTISASFVSDASMKLYMQMASPDEIIPVEVEERSRSMEKELVDEISNPVADWQDGSASPRHNDTFEDEEKVGEGMLSPRAKASANERGSEGWRDWVPESCEMLINYDGQFATSGASTRFARVGGLALPLKSLVAWISCGLNVYTADSWNVVQFINCISFMVQGSCKLQMLALATDIDTQRIAARVSAAEGGLDRLDKLDHFSWLNSVYLNALTLNAVLMWLRLFKYIGVIPQMGVLLTVLAHAGPSVLIFSCVAMVPCIGLALSYHVAFGQTLYSYSSVGLSLNSLMRM